ncbi:hypothetical protein BCR43DRAFT_336520 [Syncephalastrum racemosum]|uniref:Uncharacterized protein n=1 Tax=Syncephalastrum racemosum TaxID=13706 RepID=A0A1X2H8N6_SYNRA|nr:hypothetical protein BCR43DRAFT_336520 [Syncephalastrum racemosum]
MTTAPSIEKVNKAHDMSPDDSIWNAHPCQQKLSIVHLALEATLLASCMLLGYGSSASW